MWTVQPPQPLTSILICDADPVHTAALEDFIGRFQVRVTTLDSPARLKTTLQNFQFDLVILDLPTPSFDDFAMVREIRQQTRVPLIIVSAHNAPADRVMGLEAGADDYLGKPFDLREMVARIHAVLRRGQELAGISRFISGSDIVCFDDWELHRDARVLVAPGGLSITLSNAEFRLLTTFLQGPRRLFSRDQLMEKARGRGMDAFERSIDLLVSRLRQKLADNSGEPSIIKTVRGAGYLFDAKSVSGKSARRA
jgi:two-component system OmpR family response regulator